jgi:hypothetical protein
MAIGVRTRFEVFKRDGFTCQYCGRKSPEVVLEVDHIVPVASGGVDDVINLRTSCWACNSGKSDKPLSTIVTGEDPHDRAVLLLETERQLLEYNAVLKASNDRVDREFEELESFWPSRLRDDDRASLRSNLYRYPAEAIKRAMSIAITADKIQSLAYVGACLRNWKNEGKL